VLRPVVIFPQNRLRLGVLNLSNWEPVAQILGSKPADRLRQVPVHVQGKGVRMCGKVCVGT
jgi:hypothetical protein